MVATNDYALPQPGAASRRWIEMMRGSGGFPGRPLGEHLDQRTTSGTKRTCEDAVVLKGEAGGIKCIVKIGNGGEVEALFERLPVRLCGTKPYLNFPAASKASGIAWSGSRKGIVHAREEVSPAGELRVLVGRSRSRISDLPRLFSRIGILSEEGDAQPACSITFTLRRPID